MCAPQAVAGLGPRRPRRAYELSLQTLCVVVTLPGMSRPISSK
jgi:hypothetical protein